MRREAVQLRVELVGAARVLIVWIARFTGWSTAQRGHEHAVVVDQAQRAAAVDQDVAVLQVAVRDAEPTQLGGPVSTKSALDVRQRARLRQALLDGAVERPAVEPRHLGDRVPRLVRRARQCRDTRLVSNGPDRSRNRVWLIAA